MTWEIEKPKVPDNVNDSSNEESKDQVRLEDILGTNDQELFLKFNMTEIQSLLSYLQATSVENIADAMDLQQKALRCADILSEYIGKIVKTIGYLDASINKKKNLAALNYEPPNGTRNSIDLRKMAGEADDEVEKLSLSLAKAKASKSVLDKKYDVVIKAHHHYKEIVMGMRKVL